MKRLLVFAVLALLLAALTACYPVSTQADAPDTLSEFLGHLLTSAGIGAVIYFVLEDFPYVADEFDKLDSKAKRLTVFVLSFVVPGVALAVGVWRGYYVLTDDTIFQALAAGFEAFTLSQIAHAVRGLGRNKTPTI
jgi:hypothetical protein